MEVLKFFLSLQLNGLLKLQLKCQVLDRDCFNHGHFDPISAKQFNSII